MGLYLTRDVEGYGLWNGMPLYSKREGAFVVKNNFILNYWGNKRPWMVKLKVGEIMKIDYIDGNIRQRKVKKT